MAQTQSSPTEVSTKVYEMNDTVKIMWLAIPALGLVMGAILFIAGFTIHDDTGLSSPGMTIATRAVLAGGGILIALIGVLVYLGARRVRLVTSSRGVTLYGIGYKVYTPWSNIKKLDTDWYGGNSMYGTRFYQPRRSFEGFILYKPAVFGLSVEEGMRQNVAAIHGWALLTAQISRYTSMLPLTGFLNDFTRQELINDARKYAPETFQTTKQK